MKKVPSWMTFASGMFLVLAGLSSCGKFLDKDKDKDDEDGGQTALTGPAALVGGWAGPYWALDSEGKQLGEARQSDVSFNEDGTFRVQLREEADAKVQGTWQEFQGKSLFLTVKFSTISRIRTSSSVLEAGYELTGSSVYIKNKDFEFKLSRNTATNPGGNENGSGHAGRWRCEANGRNTMIVLSEDLHWRATVSNANGGGMISLAGSGIRDANGDLILSIRSSHPETKPGSALRFSQAGDTGRLGTVPSEGQPESLGECHRD